LIGWLTRDCKRQAPSKIPFVIERYFIVNKTQHGKKIKYMELPGLWNGSMANWNTIFVELPSSVFSPVKTVLDLLGDQHNIK
jgi:hypothetical protein